MLLVILGNIGLKNHQVHGLVLLCFAALKKKIVETCKIQFQNNLTYGAYPNFNSKS